MQAENRRDIMRARMDTAWEFLNDAEMALAAGAYKTSANRSYYCIFQAMRAVLALDGFDSKKHSGVIAEFRRKYIKTGVFPAELSDVIRDAFDIRNSSDYEDFYVASKSDVARQLEDAKAFFAAVERYIDGLAEV